MLLRFLGCALRGNLSRHSSSLSDVDVTELAWSSSRLLGKHAAAGRGLSIWPMRGRNSSTRSSPAGVRYLPSQRSNYQGQYQSCPSISPYVELNRRQKITVVGVKWKCPSFIPNPQLSLTKSDRLGDRPGPSCPTISRLIVPSWALLQSLACSVATGDGPHSPCTGPGSLGAHLSHRLFGSR